MHTDTHMYSSTCTGVIFLTGFIIERLKEEEMALKGYYGFEIMHQDLASANTSGEHHRYSTVLLL